MQGRQLKKVEKNSFYFDDGDLEKAKRPGENVKERADCGYKPALEKAEKMLNEIERR
jgi:hypothetical protein